MTDRPAVRSARGWAAYLPAALWAAVLLYAGSRSALPAPTDLPIDKVEHFLAYGALGALAAWGWRRSGRRPGRLWPLLLALAVGGADELHQRRVPGRSAEVADFVADAAGILLAYWRISQRSGEQGRGDA